jgi:hypothetical protein
MQDATGFSPWSVTQAPSANFSRPPPLLSFWLPYCHPERSEGSGRHWIQPSSFSSPVGNGQILRCAQDDRKHSADPTASLNFGMPHDE